jgi:hypothetical protein
MSQAIIAGQRASFEHAFGMMLQFIEVCPDDVWTKKFGGWPVWQQVYHALGTCQFFALKEGETPEQGLYPPEVHRFQSTPDAAPAKKDIQEYAARMKARADSYFTAMQDADLPGVNQSLTSRLRAFGVQHDFTHSQTMAMLSGHLLYHLGSCDAALRDIGLKGVF